MMDAATAEYRNATAIGSAMLRDAILKAKGYPAGAPPRLVPVPKPNSVHKHFCPMCLSQARGVRVAQIQEAVARFYDIPLVSMTSAQRRKEWAHPRQLAMYLASELTNKSLPDLGRRFGKRDHTTILYGIREAKKRIASDPETAFAARELFKGLDR